ncbi:MAG TPA: prepilin-type N-terminal cleavage/methylation domain-containing protein [Solirubrobacteraceae bacterium]|jgi:type IV pilus assembly protein PilA|nr:prepilin-type N-terminal cleavage/methylation domain-containing protein [Solirubrobacteraceae bacterium]
MLSRGFTQVSRARAVLAGQRSQSEALIRLRSQSGFTLIELLVVILIIGVLAAIAIPAFLSQTSKANDSAAKTQVGTLQTTMETYAVENSGSFANASLAKLQAIEPTLKDKSTAIAKEITGLSSTGFTIESEAVGSKDVYKLKSENGEVKRECSPVGKGGCTASGTW